MNWLKISLYSFYTILTIAPLQAYTQSTTENLNNPPANLMGVQGQPNQFVNPTQATSKEQENITVRGHRAPPPGYSYAPSMDLSKGPDPDHQRGLAESKDPVSGANLSRYGTAYRESGPMGSGKIGDSTGNGWLIPR